MVDLRWLVAVWDPGSRGTLFLGHPLYQGGIARAGVGLRVWGLQGYLAHKKQPPPLGPA